MGDKERKRKSAKEERNYMNTEMTREARREREGRREKGRKEGKRKRGMGFKDRGHPRLINHLREKMSFTLSTGKENVTFLPIKTPRLVTWDLDTWTVLSNCL